MKALVAGESGATSKRLLAIGIRALVRSASQVDATMACEGAAITEGLCFTVSLLSRWVPRQTYLPASLTLVRLFTCVHTLVDSESRALDELFSAVLKVTHMRTDATMDSLCQEVSGGATRKK